MNFTVNTSNKENIYEVLSNNISLKYKVSKKDNKVFSVQFVSMNKIVDIEDKIAESDDDEGIVGSSADTVWQPVSRGNSMAHAGKEYAKTRKEKIADASKGEKTFAEDGPAARKKTKNKRGYGRKTKKRKHKRKKKTRRRKK